jgi:two-component system, NtrC family, sensor histidine kinase PilS
VDATLEHRLKRLLMFRVVMITTLLLIAMYAEMISETLLRSVNPLYVLIVATYALTLVHIACLRFIPYLTALAYVQVVGDLMIVTGLVYVFPSATGSRGGFMLLYPICVLSGSVLLYGTGARILAGVATLFYAGMVLAVRGGLVPPRGLPDVLAMPATHVVYSIFVTGVACGTVAMMGSYLAQSLRSAGERLEEVAEEVADLRELNNVMVESIQSGLLTVDSGGRVLYVNPYGESLLGRRTAEIRGRSLPEVLSSRLLDISALRAREGDARLVRFELRYERPDGTALDLGVSVTALPQTSALGGGHLLVFQDLTEIKNLEQEVRVKEKLAAVGEMAAQLAHEIRNPLGSISGSAQILMAEPNMSTEQERLLSIITRESKRLSDTLNRVLFQARPGPNPPGPVDIGPVITEAMTLLRNGPEVSPEHRLEFEFDEGPHICLADPDQIAQVFWNLARNGLEAMPGGGVLTVRLSRRDGQLILSVRDQGRGIGREEQRQIFKPFHTRASMGTGLGLAIVYRIVSEHRGDITVRSVPAQGTEVEVRLPLIPLSASA